MKNLLTLNAGIKQEDLAGVVSVASIVNQASLVTVVKMQPLQTIQRDSMQRRLSHLSLVVGAFAADIALNE